LECQTAHVPIPSVFSLLRRHPRTKNFAGFFPMDHAPLPQAFSLT
jgi:hypothetical protein